MKRVIRKFGLSLVSAMALATLFTACGEDGKNGVDGAPGEQGAVGEPGESCSAKPLADDSGYTLTCGDKDVGVIRNGVDGVNGKDGAGCMADPMANGDYKISCGGVVVGVLFNGNGGSDGQGETGGTSCSAKALADGSGYTLTCGGVKVGTISNGRDGYSCRAGQNEDKTVTTITCETADGEVSYEVANGKDGKGDKGDDGVGCEVSRNGYELTITCANSEEVVDLRDFIVEADPDVTPDPVPGSNSSTSEVKPDGYYSNSSNCPEGLTCKYATNTDYLNSTKTYGEYLDTRDGQVYKTIKICDEDNKNCQTWMAQNLNYAPDPETVSSMGGYAWSGCYDNESANCSKYGRLYTWEVAMDKAGCGYGTDCNNSYEGTQGVCPEGWHLPTNTDWQTLFTNVGGTNTAGKLLKANTSLWYENTGTDSFGFAVLPAGYRNNDGDFRYGGNYADFWSSTEGGRNGAYFWEFGYNLDSVLGNRYSKDYAISVRCLRD